MVLEQLCNPASRPAQTPAESTQFLSVACSPRSSEKTRTIVSRVIRRRLEKDTSLLEGANAFHPHVERISQLCTALEERSGKELFPRLLAQINTRSWSTAKESYRDIAKELFSDGVQWGRIIALVAFTGYAAERAAQEDRASLTSSLITWLQDLLIDDHHAWMQRHGGWVSRSGTSNA